MCSDLGHRGAFHSLLEYRQRHPVMNTEQWLKGQTQRGEVTAGGHTAHWVRAEIQARCVSPGAGFSPVQESPSLEGRVGLGVPQGKHCLLGGAASRCWPWGEEVAGDIPRRRCRPETGGGRN